MNLQRKISFAELSLLLVEKAPCTLCFISVNSWMLCTYYLSFGMNMGGASLQPM